MFHVKSNALELRGIATKTPTPVKVYYMLNVEGPDGTPYSLYCPNGNALPQGLKKGDNIFVTFEVRYYQGKERLVVVQVERAE